MSIKRVFYMLKPIFSLVILSLPLLALSQKQERAFKNDTSYYETFYRDVTVRLFITQKAVNFVLPAGSASQNFEYDANTKLNTGVGVSWHNLTLNLYYGFRKLNDDDAKGSTKGLDLQLHVYPRRWALDLLLVMPHGFHALPKGYAATPPNDYYYREDAKVRIYGINAYRVPNKAQFSYRAAMAQHEWQKKSAGSLLYGGAVNMVINEAEDSAMIPSALAAGYPQAGITEFKYISIGPGIGYAYTFVVAKHFFIMGSMIGSLNLNLTTEERGDEQTKKASIGPSANYKGAIGYNSNKWGLVASMAGHTFWGTGESSSKFYHSNASFWRLSLSRKLWTKKHGM